MSREKKPPRRPGALASRPWPGSAVPALFPLQSENPEAAGSSSAFSSPSRGGPSRHTEKPEQRTPDGWGDLQLERGATSRGKGRKAYGAVGRSLLCTGFQLPPLPGSEVGGGELGFRNRSLSTGLRIFDAITCLSADMKPSVSNSIYTARL